MIDEAPVDPAKPALTREEFREYKRLTRARSQVQIEIKQLQQKDLNLVSSLESLALKLLERYDQPGDMPVVVQKDGTVEFVRPQPQQSPPSR